MIPHWRTSGTWWERAWWTEPQSGNRRESNTAVFIFNYSNRGNARREKLKTYEHLLCHSRELEDVEGLVVHGGALVDVDDHAGFTSTAEEALQVVGQLAFPEGNMLQQPEGGSRQTAGVDTSASLRRRERE